jgi:hypothetical protein
MTMHDTPRPDRDTPSVSEIQRMAAAHLSTRARAGYVTLLLVSATMAVMLGSLWLTEPRLPLRTHVAFGLIVAVAISWTGFALWVLTRRRVLFGVDRLVAARMALLFSVVSAASLLAAAHWSAAGRMAFAAGLAEIPLCALAAALLVRAQRRVRALSRRKQEIEQQLAQRQRQT